MNVSILRTTKSLKTNYLQSISLYSPSSNLALFQLSQIVLARLVPTNVQCFHMRFHLILHNCHLVYGYLSFLHLDHLVRIVLLKILNVSYFSHVDSTIFSFHIIGFNVNFFLYDSFFPFIVSSLRTDSYNVTLF